MSAPAKEPPRPSKSSANEGSKYKSSLSSMLLSLAFSNSVGKNALRGLSCTSAPDVRIPSSALRPPSSADWEFRNPSRNPRETVEGRKKMKKKKKTQVVNSDVWCAPGIPFSTDADSVACVVSRRPQAESSSGSKRNPRHQRNEAADFTFDVDSILRERPYLGRLSTMLEHMSETDPPLPSSSTMTYSCLSGLHRNSGDLTDLQMLQSSVLLGGMDLCDQYTDWRLDVDNMTYEELLELGDSIGHVSTGLNEEQVARCLRKMKYSSTLSSNFACETERKCSICQEEYENKDELGKLECGHNFHMCCIKQWLFHKNACPVCKSVAAATSDR